MNKSKNAFYLVFVFMLVSQWGMAQSFQSDEPVASSKEEKLKAMGAMFVEMMNSGSVEKADELARKLFVPDAVEGLAKQLIDEYGSIEKASIRVMPDQKSFHVIAWVKKLKAWRNFQLGQTDEEPFLTRRLAIVLAAPPIELPEGELTDPNVINALGDYMAMLAEDEGLTGSFVITKGEEVMLKRVYGFANREKGRKMTEETPINLASTSKTFTAVAILRLVEAGKLSLDDPLSKFLPDYPNISFAKKATVKHLLSHSAGLGDYWDDEYEKHWGEISRLEQYLPFVTRQPLRHTEPGSKGIYSNSGFILLGLIIEAVTGQDYFEHIQQTLFDPLEMKHTGFYKSHEEDLIAVGYFDFLPGEGMRARGGLMGSSAGGAYSTAADLLKFRKALLEHQLLSKAMLDVATSKQMTLEGGGTEYGLGFTLNSIFKPGFGHGGQGPGGAVTFEIDPEHGYTLVMLSNSLNGAYSELLFTLREFCSRK